MDKSSGNPQVDVSPKVITAANLNYVLMGMDAEDKLVLSPKKDGTVSVSIHTKGKHRSQLQNRLHFTLNPQPVTQSWMPMNLEDDGSGRHARVVAKKAAAKHAIKEKNNFKELLKQTFELGLAFRNIGDAEVHEHSLATYYRFKLSNYFVYTKADKRPVMYTVGEGGELTYL